MSLEAIDIMNVNRDDQLSLSPSSEVFQIVGGDTFSGIFDRAHLEDNKDSGNILQKKLTPMIMVSEIPAGLDGLERTALIRRESWVSGDKEYTFNFAGLDEEGVPVIWLF